MLWKKDESSTTDYSDLSYRYWYRRRNKHGTHLTHSLTLLNVGNIRQLHSIDGVDGETVLLAETNGTGVGV